MRGLNCKFQFERAHAMLVLASDLDLKIKVVYWPKFGTWVKLNIKYFWLIFGVVAALNGRSLKISQWSCDLDLELLKMRSKLRGQEIAAFRLAPPIDGLLVVNNNSIHAILCGRSSKCFKNESSIRPASAVSCDRGW